MGRLHLFELEDLDRFPAAFRDMGTDVLRFVINAFVPSASRGCCGPGYSRSSP